MIYYCWGFLVYLLPLFLCDCIFISYFIDFDYTTFLFALIKVGCTVKFYDTGSKSQRLVILVVIFNLHKTVWMFYKITQSMPEAP